MANRAVNRYRDLVLQAEQLKESTQFEVASRQLKLLQQTWREVGGSLPKSKPPSCGRASAGPIIAFSSALSST